MGVEILFSLRCIQDIINAPQSIAPKNRELLKQIFRQVVHAKQIWLEYDAGFLKIGKCEILEAHFAKLLKNLQIAIFILQSEPNKWNKSDKRSARGYDMASLLAQSRMNNLLYYKEKFRSAFWTYKSCQNTSVLNRQPFTPGHLKTKSPS